MRVFVMAVAGLLAAAGARAQQGGVKLGTPARALLTSGACPGQLAARQQATGGATVWTTAYEDRGDKADWIARPRGLGIHVEFRGAKSAVKALELRVRYLPLGLRRMPVDPGVANVAGRSPQERAKTFNLDREAAMRIGGDLLVGPAATITRVQLLSATFADGSVWHASSEDVCSVAPSLYMPVEAKR